MALKPDNPRSDSQAQADRPPVFGPLAAGVVVIKGFAAIKGESAFGAPTYDLMPEDTPGGGQRALGYGLSVPPANEPAAGPEADTPYTSLPSPPSEPGMGEESHAEGRPPDTLAHRSQGRTGDSDFQPADGPTPIQVPELAVGARAASEPAGVAATGGAEPLAGSVSSAGSDDARAAGGEADPRETARQW